LLALLYLLQKQYRLIGSFVYFFTFMSAQSDPIRRWTLYSRSFLIRFIVNLINILRAAFAPIFFCQKITNPKCKWRKAAQSSNVRNRRALNMLMINWPLAFNLHTLTCGRIDIVWPILNTSDIFCRLGLSQECDKPLLFSYPRIWVRAWMSVSLKYLLLSTYVVVS